MLSTVIAPAPLEALPPIPEGPRLRPPPGVDLWCFHYEPHDDAELLAAYRKLLTDDGWFPTNDGGWLDDEGYLFVTGRIDDVIVRGGENMSPGEIEDVLHDHAAVKDVCVVGVPDEEWGEAVAAVVVLEAGSSATAEELKGHVKERLRSSRVPQVLRFVDELPYNETGKLLRRVVREDLAASE